MRKKKLEDRVALAKSLGREQADEALSRRVAVRSKRIRLLKRRAKRGLTVERPTTMKFDTADVGLSSGVLVAEGDSWFDYPFNDVLRILDDSFGYDVESVAHKGDRIEEMAYSGGQLDDFVRRIEKVLARGQEPRAILLSGGGNDIAGSEFGMLLNDARSAIAGFSESVLQGVLDERVFYSYVTIVSRVTAVCRTTFGSPIPILVHGYDYPVPDGRGFLGGWWFLPGPWLQPGFREKGFSELPKLIDLAKDLIDRFNTVLERVSTTSEFQHVKYIDLRGTLSVGSDYKTWWANELHPTPRGFRAVTDRFAKALDTLG